MTSLSTRATKNKFDKAIIANKLDTLVKKVTKRGIYVITRNESNSYDVINYLTQGIMIQDIPTKHLADRVVNRLNAGRMYDTMRIREIRQALAHYQKLNLDCAYYMYTILNSTSMEKVELSEIRKEDAEAKMSSVLRVIKNLI